MCPWLCCPHIITVINAIPFDHMWSSKMMQQRGKNWYIACVSRQTCPQLAKVKKEPDAPKGAILVGNV